MKLLRYGPLGGEKPAMLDSAGKMRDLSKFTSDLYPDVITEMGLKTLRGVDPNTLPLVEGNPRIGAPVARVVGPVQPDNEPPPRDSITVAST